jgi:serine/threonine protein phosphatase PrpC
MHGGHAAGEIASGTIVNTIARKQLRAGLCQLSQSSVAVSKWLQEAVEAANTEVYSRRHPHRYGPPGGCRSAGNLAYVAHVGDSRAYLINAQASGA